VADASDDEPADPDVPAGNEHCHDGAERIADEVERRGAGESQQQLKVLCHLRLAVVGGVMRRIGEAVAPRVECEHLVAGEDECADDPGVTQFIWESAANPCWRITGGRRSSSPHSP